MEQKQQRGITLISMLFFGIIVVFVALIVMKLVPAYVEYFTIKHVLTDIGNDPEIKSMDNSAIRQKFLKRTLIDEIHSIKPDDLEITRAHGATVISADYQFQTKLAGNVSLLVDFHASSDGLGGDAAQQGE
jgi:Domain of unknown function (DUF4845)